MTFPTIICAASFALAMAVQACEPSEPVTPLERSTSYDDLISLFQEFRQFQRPVVTDGVPDYTPAAMRAQKNELDTYMRRLDAIDPRGWPVHQRIDYLLVRAEMNGLDFDHRVLKPWSRDPAWYIVVTFQFGPKMHDPIRLPRLPLAENRIDEFRVKLQAVPAILAQAKANLTEPTADLVMLGIRSKDREAEMLEAFLPELEQHHPDLVSHAEAALDAVQDFRAWLEAGRETWTGPSGLGVENYEWYLRNVQLLPYTWTELLAISTREYERAMAMIKLEEHRNRRVPPLEIKTGRDEYVEFYNEAQELLLDFLRNEEIMTIPEWMVLRPIQNFRPQPVMDYFTHIQVRDPLPLQPHDFVGHSPDAERHRRDDRPIRGTNRLYFIDGIRAEALATGTEELLMHAGLLGTRPRARELAYNLLAFRGSRSISDLRIHSNEFTLMEGFQFNIGWTPYGWLPEDSPTMWHDIELYLRQPGYGVGYLIGSVQLQKLMADRGRQLGESFVLKDFMDSCYASGMIPLSLIRWEMTGLEDEVRELWPEGFAER